MLQCVLNANPKGYEICSTPKEKGKTPSLECSLDGRSQAQRSWTSAGGSPTTVEDLVNETFWPDVLHIHLKRRLHGNRKNKMYRSLPVKAAMYAVIDKSNETSCNNNT